MILISKHLHNKNSYLLELALFNVIYHVWGDTSTVRIYWKHIGTTNTKDRITHQIFQNSCRVTYCMVHITTLTYLMASCSCIHFEQIIYLLKRQILLKINKEGRKCKQKVIPLFMLYPVLSTLNRTSCCFHKTCQGCFNIWKRSVHMPLFLAKSKRRTPKWG